MRDGDIILKDFNKYLDRTITYSEYREKVDDYGNKLEKKGWKRVPIEGGYVSPDLSTLYIDFRSPYYGQLLQQTERDEENYKKVCKELLDSGDFVILKW